MNFREPSARVIKAGLIALLLIVCLGSEYPHRAALPWPFLNRTQAEVFATFQTPDLQWLISVCMSIYLIGFIWLLRPLKSERLFWGDNSVILGVVIYALGVLVYAWNYDEASKSTNALLFFFGITLFFAFRFWRAVEVKRSRPVNIAGVVLGFTLIFLCIGAVWRPESFQGFQYRGQPRWSGLWDNPNTFGILMGVGCVLAAGLVVSGVKCQVSGRMADGGCKMPDAGLGIQKAESRNRGAESWHWIRVILFIAAAVVCGIGLIKSYSRGAWVGAAVGLGYLVWSWWRAGTHLTPALSPHPVGGEGDLECGDLSPLFPPATARSAQSADKSAHSNMRFAMPLGIIVISLAVLAFWSFRHTERTTARRAFSVANVNDFSWRNRMAAGEGGLQMMANKPLLGFGWSQPESVYEHYFRSPKVNESAAIQMNDYFALGTTLGIPALVCFLIYVGLSLSQNPLSSIQHPASSSPPVTRHLSLVAVCRAGAIVLLVGFWFDGGLFKLATGAVFWILLELGSAGTDQQKLIEAGT